jgi:hypothetical protein
MKALSVKDLWKIVKGLENKGLIITARTEKEIIKAIHDALPDVLDLEKVKEATIDLVDRYFPKHQCKERGAAMVLYAEMLMTICKEFSSPAIVLPDKELYRDLCHCEPPMERFDTERNLIVCENCNKQVGFKTWNTCLRKIKELNKGANEER